MSSRKRPIQMFGLALFACLLSGTLAGEAAAQSTWQKMKMNILQQQCQQGLQKACQSLAEMKQKLSQQNSAPQAPVQQPGQPGLQPQNSRAPQQVGRGSNQSGPIHPPNGTRVEETVMAPRSDRATFFISPHGVHVATLEHSGSREVIYYDGVAGPKFDEFIGGQANMAAEAQVVFSPDGKRYAYCGHVGNEFVVMVDGKELARSSESQLGRFNENSCKLGFTSNSQHVFYTSSVAKSSAGPDHFVRFVWDGKPDVLPGTSSLDGGVSFSPDGNHYAYIAVDPADRQKWALVIDGKIAPYRGGDPQWSADSRHLYTILLSTPPSGRGQVAEAMLDGKPFMRANRITLHVAPVGNMLVAEVNTAEDTTQPLKFIVVNGKKVPGTEIVNQGGADFDQVTISPDGKHYAARFTTTDNHQYVFVDGKRGQVYQSVNHILFTSDSSKVTYTAFSNGPYAIIGDEESETCLLEATGPVIDSKGALVVAPTGGRAGGLCGPNGAGGPTVYLDGKTLRVPEGVKYTTDLRFSPDGQHYAYQATFQGNAHRLIVDGVVQMNSNPMGHYVFSPDSKHIAVASAPPNASEEPTDGIFLDGKYIPTQPTSSFPKLEFTADSQHIVWAQGVQGGLRIFVDGKAVAEAEIALAATSTEAWWDMAPDGSLSILAQDENNLKRITITPSPENSIATFGGGSALVAERNR